jgi:hypothetical protein
LIFKDIRLKMQNFDYLSQGFNPFFPGFNPFFPGFNPLFFGEDSAQPNPEQNSQHFADRFAAIHTIFHQESIPIATLAPAVPIPIATLAPPVPSVASSASFTKKGKHQYCDLHGKQKHICKQCGGKNICNHGVQKNQCTKCGGKGICEHGRVRWQCFPCGGKSMCTHGRRKARCKECGGNAICQHDRVKYECRLCKAAKKAAAKLAERDHPESLFALVRAECPESVVQTSQ